MGAISGMVTGRPLAQILLVAVLLHAGVDLAGAQEEAAAPDLPDCEHAIWPGFDSRLEVESLGDLGDLIVHPVAVSAANDALVVASGSHLQLLRGTAEVRLPLAEELLGLLTGPQGELWIHTTTSVSRVTASGPQVDEILTSLVDIQLVRDRADSFLGVAPAGDDTVRLFAFSLEGEIFPLAELEGPFATAWWGPGGLAVAAGGRLLYWGAGEAQMMQLAIDEGLDLASDIALVGERRIVVSLPNSLLLFTETSSLVLAGIGGSLDWHDGRLYVVDAGTRLIWVLSGLDALGNRAEDLEHAGRLIRRYHEGAGESPELFLESARIVGCDMARLMLAEQDS